MVVERTGTTLELRAPDAGVYRVVVFTELGAPWLFSSSIRVTTP